MDFSSLTPTDSYGLPILAYPLSFYRGSILNPGPWGQANFVDIELGLYKAIAWFWQTLLNVVSAFDWLRPFVNLLEQVSDSISARLGAAGVLAMALGVAACGAGVNWLRRTHHRTLYHLGLTVLLLMIAITMVSPVRMAGELLGVGRDWGTEVGTAAAGTPHGSTLSQTLADRLVREQVQRWNYGHDLDSLGCGQAWTNAIRAGDANKVKDVPLSCPGGQLGQQLHDYAMNPDNAVFDGFLNIGCQLVFALFSAALMAKLLRTGFATVLHAAAIKPLMPLVPAAATMQNLFVRNGLAAGLGGGEIFLDVLIYIIGAAFTAGIAILAGPGAAASLITAGAMVGVVIGTRQFTKNLRERRTALATQITRSPGPPPILGSALPAGIVAQSLMSATPALRALHPALAPAALAGASPTGRTPTAATPTTPATQPDQLQPAGDGPTPLAVRAGQVAAAIRHALRAPQQPTASTAAAQTPTPAATFAPTPRPSPVSFDSPTPTQGPLPPQQPTPIPPAHSAGQPRQPAAGASPTPATHGRQPAGTPPGRLSGPERITDPQRRSPHPPAADPPVSPQAGQDAARSAADLHQHRPPPAGGDI